MPWSPLWLALSALHLLTSCSAHTLLPCGQGHLTAACRGDPAIQAKASQRLALSEWLEAAESASGRRDRCRLQPLRSPSRRPQPHVPKRCVRPQALARTRSVHASLLDPGEAAGAVAALGDWAQARGAAGLLAFGAAHVLAIVVCFPATILFEFTEGFLFGLGAGLPLAWAAKVTAACVTYALASAFAPFLNSTLAADAIGAAIAGEPKLAALADGVAANGLRLTLLARLSPVPSWANNYGLALAGVRIRDYVPATVVASLPPVLTHVYVGAGMASVLGVVERGAADSGVLGSLLGAVGVLASAALVRQCLVLAATEAPESESLSDSGASERR